ncbi:DNA segregation ATPase FtsK/SpoIIIE-like protein, partial [Chelatococcus caeni]
MRKRELPSRNSETDAADVLPNPLRAAGRLRRNRLPEEPATTAPKLTPHPATIVLPTHVRYARTPDKLRQMEAALAAEAAIAAEPAPGAPKAGTTRVKFGRTPDHLIQQVWKGILPTVPPQEDVPADAPVAPEAPSAEGHAPATSFSQEQIAAEAPSAEPMELTEGEDVPFVAISDHAFFEFDCSPAVLPATPAGLEVSVEQEVVTPPATYAPEAYAAEDYEPETHQAGADEPESEEQAAPAAVSADTVEAWWSHAYSVNLRLVGSTGIEQAFTAAPTQAREPAVEESLPEEPALQVAAASEPRDPEPRTPEAPKANAIAVPPGNDNRVARREVARPPVAAPKPAAATAPVPARQPAPPPAAEAFELPPMTLLAEPPVSTGTGDAPEFIEQNAALLESTLEDFGVKGEIINAHPGPVVTLYELEPAPGTKSSRVISLADDIARSMSAVSARVAVVPGRNAIGIELPNARRETVYLRELLASQDFEQTRLKLALCLGKTIGGEPVIAELARMPHLLVAGTTGSGKSVAINTMILSL